MKMITGKILFLAIIMTILIGANVFAQSSDNEPLVSLDLKDVDVRSAIDMLFRGTGKNYTIASDVQGMIASFKATNMPFDAALKSLTRTAGLVSKLDQGMYNIKKFEPITPGAGIGGIPGIEAGPTTIVETPAARETIIDKVPLNHLGASELLAMIGGNTGGGTMGSYGMGGMGMGSMGMMGGMGSMGMMGGMSGMSGMGSFGGGTSSYNTGRSNYNTGRTTTGRW